MIYIQNSEVRESEFLNLLEKTRKNCLEKIQKAPNPKMEGVPFENLVFEKMCIASENTQFEGFIEQTGKQSFPDIVAKKYYGIEVKVTAEDKWLSTGNSVAEGTRRSDVERIYMFFGKLGGVPDIKYRPYQECLYEVAVTHSPRYKINMELSQGKSIFDKIKLDYDSLRQEKNPIQKFKSYYRKLLKEGEELWWIDQSQEENDQPIIRFLNKFNIQEKEDFIINSMIFFPEIFGNNNKIKFERAAAFLLNNYKAISYNLRDFFTSQGKVNLKVGKKSVKVPRIFFKLQKFAKEIKNKINTIPEDKLLYNWRVNNLKEDKIEFWKKQLDINSRSNFSKVRASEIFESGLNEKKN